MQLAQQDTPDTAGNQQDVAAGPLSTAPERVTSPVFRKTAATMLDEAGLTTRQIANQRMSRTS